MLKEPDRVVNPPNSNTKGIFLLGPGKYIILYNLKIIFFPPNFDTFFWIFLLILKAYF